MDILALLTNPYLIASLGAWCIAQVAKVIIHAIVYRSFDLHRLFGDGGMPSGHSATVMGLCTITLLKMGPGSFEFAVTAILATIVCHDAMGVRREAGKHAELLFEMAELFESLSKEPLPEVKLKKFVGHTPMQVFVGGAIGVLHGMLMWLFFYS